MKETACAASLNYRAPVWYVAHTSIALYMSMLSPLTYLTLHYGPCQAVVKQASKLNSEDNLFLCITGRTKTTKMASRSKSCTSVSAKFCALLVQPLYIFPPTVCITFSTQILARNCATAVLKIYRIQRLDIDLVVLQGCITPPVSQCVITPFISVSPLFFYDSQVL